MFPDNPDSRVKERLTRPPEFRSEVIRVRISTALKAHPETLVMRVGFLAKAGVLLLRVFDQLAAAGAGDICFLALRLVYLIGCTLLVHTRFGLCPVPFRTFESSSRSSQSLSRKRRQAFPPVRDRMRYDPSHADGPSRLRSRPQAS